MDDDLKALVTIAIACLIVGAAVGHDFTMAYYRKQAVENGVAEWVIKDASGTVEFKWRATK